VTGTYRLIVPKSVRKTVEALSAPLQARIVARLDALSENPRPRGVVKLAGQPSTFRLRIGTWRIVYQIFDAEPVVLLVKVAHRREVYRS
jgi:mRNA interferase RelE/StbE